MRLVPLELSLFETLPKDVQLAMRLSGVVPVLDPFMDLWDLPEGTHTIVLMSGRGTGKTHVVSELTANVVAAMRKRCVVLRDEKSKIKDTILNEILMRFDELPYDTSGILRQETGLKEAKKDGKTLVFTMGFKASSNAKTANMKGPSDIDIAIVEEAEDIRDVDKFNSFTDGLRKEGCLVIIILNTPDKNHWILKRYFDVTEAAPIPENVPIAKHKDFEGYFICTPKPLPGVVCIQSNFRSNFKLPQQKIKDYMEYCNPESSRYNPHHWMTSTEGFASTGRKGQILRNVQRISLSEYLNLSYKEIYGQDFGTASPAGLVGVKFHKNNCYVRQLNYEPMDTLSLGKLYCTLKFTPSDCIIADSAEPKTIARLQSGWMRDELLPADVIQYPMLTKGWFVEEAIKGPGSIKTGIGLLTSMTIHAVTESVDLWNEINNWVYDKDKNEMPTDEPIDDYNHLLDPLRYVATKHKGSTNIGNQLGYFR